MKTGLVYGLHAVAQQLERAPQQAIELCCQPKTNDRLLRLIEMAQVHGIKVSRHSRSHLTNKCASAHHQGCVLIIRDAQSRLNFDQCLDSINPQTLLLVLDGIQDPHNLGACLRTADASGVDAVMIPRNRAVGLNATVRKVAAGAADAIPLIEITNIARSLEALKHAGVWIFGTSESATESLYKQHFSGPVALVMGAEGRGLRRLTREACDYLIRLPMRGRVESLNVSVATGICLYEIQRAREFASKSDQSC